MEEEIFKKLVAQRKLKMETEKEISEKFARQFKRGRISRSLSVEDVAISIGITKKQVLDNEANTRHPDVKEMERLADLFQCSPRFFVTYSENPFGEVPEEELGYWLNPILDHPDGKPDLKTRSSLWKQLKDLMVGQWLLDDLKPGDGYRMPEKSKNLVPEILENFHAQNTLKEILLKYNIWTSKAHFAENIPGIAVLHPFIGYAIILNESLSFSEEEEKILYLRGFGHMILDRFRDERDSKKRAIEILKIINPKDTYNHSRALAQDFAMEFHKAHPERSLGNQETQERILILAKKGYNRQMLSRGRLIEIGRNLELDNQGLIQLVEENIRYG